MKRSWGFFLLTGLIAAMAIGFAGCLNYQPPAPTPTPVSSASPSPTPVTINWSYYNCDALPDANTPAFTPTNTTATYTVANGNGTITIDTSADAAVTNQWRMPNITDGSVTASFTVLFRMKADAANRVADLDFRFGNGTTGRVSNSSCGTTQPKACRLKSTTVRIQSSMP